VSFRARRISPIRRPPVSKFGHSRHRHNRGATEGRRLFVPAASKCPTALDQRVVQRDGAFDAGFRVVAWLQILPRRQGLLLVHLGQRPDQRMAGQRRVCLAWPGRRDGLSLQLLQIDAEAVEDRRSDVCPIAVPQNTLVIGGQEDARSIAVAGLAFIKTVVGGDVDHGIVIKPEFLELIDDSPCPLVVGHKGISVFLLMLVLLEKPCRVALFAAGKTVTLCSRMV
jgi:hypothetical protein